MKQIIPRFYSEIVENDMRRMILKTLISESDRFEQLAKFYHKGNLGSRAKMRLKILLGTVSKMESSEMRPLPSSRSCWWGQP
ncbi:MAG: hypothetical protein R3C56_15660 [Pirellulaceae bacterium]